MANLISVPNAPGYVLDAPAARSLGRAIAAGCPVAITSARRTPEVQQALYNAYRAGTGNFALPPAQSEHVTGNAIDAAEPMRSWLTYYGRGYGWVRTDAREPWHFAYRYGYDTHLAPPTPTTTTHEDEDETMAVDARELLAMAYRNELGREAAEVELYPRLRRIAAGTSTLAQEVDGIDKAVESNRYAVHQLYVSLLGRAGTVADYDRWIASTGNNIAAIEAGIRGSDEYKSKH